MDENMSISNAEMKVMNHIWKTGAMITVPEMLAILNEEGEEWTYPTVATFLRRLETKGILGVTKKGNKLCYFPLVSKEQYETKEAEGFVESKFGGSLKNFLVAFRGSDKISKKDMSDTEGNDIAVSKTELDVFLKIVDKLFENAGDTYHQDSYDT